MMLITSEDIKKACELLSAQFEHSHELAEKGVEEIDMAEHLASCVGCQCNVAVCQSEPCDEYITSTVRQWADGELDFSGALGAAISFGLQVGMLVAEIRAANPAASWLED